MVIHSRRGRGRRSRTSRTFVGLALLAIGMALSGTARTVRADADADADHAYAVAPRDCWPMRDACPARTRATATRAPRDATHQAWVFKAPGTIVGEPLVWMDRVVVESASGGKHFLDVLDLREGKPCAGRRKYKTSHALAPAIWNDTILIRKDSDALEALRIVPAFKRLTTVWCHKGKIETEPLLLESDVLVVEDEALCRYQIGATSPVWTVELPGRAVGRLGVRGGRVVVLASEGMHVYSCRLDGTDVRSDRVGQDAKSRNLMLGPKGYVIHGAGWSTPRRGTPKGCFVLDPQRIFPLAIRARTTAWKDTVYACIESPEEGNALLAWNLDGDPTRPESMVILAGAGSHEAYAGSRLPLCVADGVVFSGAGSFETATGKIVEEPLQPWKGCIVPARGTILEVQPKGRLVAWRSRKTVASPLSRSTDEAATTSATQGVAVLADGRVHTGALRWSSSDQRLFCKRGPKKGIPYDAVMLVLDDDGKIVLARDGDAACRALPRAVGAKTSHAWLGLAKYAYKMRAVTAARAYAREAERRGAKAATVAKLIRDARRYEERNPGKCAPSDKKKKVDERFERLSGEEGRAVFHAASSAADCAPFDVQVDLLREVLEQYEGQAEAIDWVRHRIPEGLTPGTPFDALEWLRFVEAAAHQPIAVVTPSTGGSSRSRERVTVERERWRRDVVGLETDQIVIVTPASKPGRIANCLDLGELVCSTLDGFFGGEGQAAEEGAAPLVLLLYESQKAYIEETPGAKDNPAFAARLARTAGHYSPELGVSRLYVPDDPEAFARVMDVFAHELTHHWLDQRLRFLREGAGRGIPPTAPGAVLEEGFATMIEESHFDLRTRTWQPADHRADSIDIVANAEMLLAWDTLVDMSLVDLYKLSPEDGEVVPMRWQLGVHRIVEWVSMFYAQGGALCHYLANAEGGRHREALFDWVADLHAGRTKPGEIEERFGCDATELGRRVKAWCRVRVAGPGHGKE